MKTLHITKVLMRQLTRRKAVKGRDSKLLLPVAWLKSPVEKGKEFQFAKWMEEKITLKGTTGIAHLC